MLAKRLIVAAFAAFALVGMSLALTAKKSLFNEESVYVPTAIASLS